MSTDTLPPPARRRDMPNDPTHTLVALVPNAPNGDASLPKLLGYNIIKNEAEILANPDWPLFPSEEAAIKSLRRGSRSPAGTTRVIKLSDIPYGARHHLQRQYGFVTRWGQIHNRIGNQNRLPDYVLADTPIIVDPANLADATLEMFKRLPVLCADDKHLKLLQRKFPDARLTDNSILFGLQTLQLPRLTRNGQPYRSPRATLALSREQLLYTHNACESLYPTLTVFYGTLDEAFTLKSTSRHTWGSTHTPMPLHNKHRTPLDGKWESQIAHATSAWQSLANNLESLCNRSIHPYTWTPHRNANSQPVLGCCSTLPRMFRRFPDRHHKVLLALSLFHVWLPRLAPAARPEPCHRISDTMINNNLTVWARARRALYSLARICGCRTYPSLDVSPLLQESDS